MIQPHLTVGLLVCNDPDGRPERDTEYRFPISSVLKARAGEHTLVTVRGGGLDLEGPFDL
jgi:hypothetical protein